MRHIICLVVCCVMFSCNNDSAPDCFQNTGDIIELEFVVDAFDKITVFEGVELTVTDAPTQKVIVQTGEYLLSDVNVSVVEGRLILKDENGCNIAREYDVTKVFVSSPNITEIRNSSDFTVSSNGVLNYPNLNLLSENFGNEDLYSTIGDFNLQVNTTELRLSFNNLSTAYISGNVTNLFVGFYSGDSRFEGANLMAQNIQIYQRSSNDMMLNPQLSLTGEIRSTGDVILVNEPPFVDVQQFYTGQLIIQ
ncbi:MAG TPA: head GIN domain-containing protein [Aquaticitalea sp.]|nr:head GIN domain-containing protein [Aquaticitalea sp.]